MRRLTSQVPEDLDLDTAHIGVSHAGSDIVATTSPFDDDVCVDLVRDHKFAIDLADERVATFTIRRAEAEQLHKLCTSMVGNLDLKFPKLTKGFLCCASPVDDETAAELLTDARAKAAGQARRNEIVARF